MADAASTASIRDKLLADRRGLLDLGARNRLIDTPLRAKGVRTIEIIDETSSDIYRLLTAARRSSSPRDRAWLRP